MARVGTKHLITEVNRRTNISESMIKRVIQEYLFGISKHLAKKDSINLPRIGTLCIKLRKPSKRLLFGHEEVIFSGNFVSFKASGIIKKVCNGKNT